MLSVAQLKRNINYYLELATLSYYQKGGEPVGKWCGIGAERLKLGEAVREDVIKNIAAGFSADGCRKLVQNAGKENRQIGWDLTFSAPKSVSVLWSAASPEMRREIQEAQDTAVRKTVEHLEETAASRTGSQGNEQEDAGLIVALFEHGSSRANDPQLHTHALFLNVGVDEAGKTRTILSSALYQQKLTAGALYRTELAHQLVERLGVRLERKEFSFKIKGVPQKLCDSYSKRRNEVVTALRKAGQCSAHAAQIATLETRRPKDTLPRKELFKKWKSEAAKHGFGEKQIERITGRRKLRRRPLISVQGAFRQLSSEHAFFSKNEMLREAALRTQVEAVSLVEVKSVTEQFLKSDASVHQITKRTNFTSVDNLQEEEALLSVAKRLTERECCPVDVKKIESKLMDHQTNPMNWEQAAALGHITLRKDSISIVQGRAGTGKTQMLKTATELWRRNGNRVLGLCVAGKAARGLQEATGMRTETIAKFLYDNDKPLLKQTRHHLRQFRRAFKGQKTTRYRRVKLKANTVLVIDEAAMLSTQDMRQILEEVEKANAKIVLVGDSKQLQPIDRGNPFHALAERLGAIQIDEIQRQQNPFDKKMVIDVSEGNMQSALSNLADRGLVHLAEDRLSAIKQLVSDWGSTTEGSQSLILVPSKCEAAEVNRRCQKTRQLHGTVKNGIGINVQGQTIQVGDRIQFFRRNRSLGLENGDFAVVETVNRSRKTLTVRLDSGRKVLVPVKIYDSIQLGYATTVHKGQGATVDRAFVLLGGYQQDRHLTYVQLSRARAETRVYIDRFESGQDYAHLVASMERDRQRPLALDLAKIEEVLSQSP